MSVLDVSALRKEFGSLVAVDDVSFEVYDGEFISVLGPSGSGKSTILRMLAGFERPTAGEVYMNDEPLTGRPPFERDVNIVFQDLALFPHMTVSENIAYGLKQQNVPADERRERVAEMLEMVDLEGYGDRDPDELSGGEQQRVALARAVVNRPDVVLLDEPLASLDRKLRQHMQVELQRVQAETGITFLYVTHDQEVAMAVSDRLAVLNEGRIEQIGSTEDIFEAPSSQFVADFIGDVNSVEAAVLATSSDNVALRCGDSEIEFSRADAGLVDADDLAEGDTVSICVRPHLLEIGERGAVGGPWTVDGQVDNRIYMGEEVEYIVKTDVGEFSVYSEVPDFEIGDAVTVSIPVDSVHVFH